MDWRKVSTFLVSALLLAACGDNPATPDGGACAPGEEGCACLEGSICQGGLVCEMGLCRGVQTTEVEVGDPNARSCELVVIEDTTEILDVDFTDGTMGTHVHESPRTAVTFTREDDTPFTTGSVLLRRTEGAGSLRMTRARCFDRDGNVLGGDPLRLVE